ncbi:MAG: DNA polymerase Y family protein [Gammaproteobacteria bacterium]|nr:DNA polymerase Y family protein [Gammaproteobacteria bacterium]
MAAIGEKNQGRKTSAIQADAWLCLRFTHLSLNSSGFSVDSVPATAITDNQQVWQCNTLAIKSGVHAGMSVNHALMLDPELILLQRDASQEAQKLQELSYWAYRFTSLVSVYNDHTLLLEIGRSINLFNGLKHLLHLIYNDLSGFNILAEAGIAHTPKAAHVLSFNHHIDTASENPLLGSALACLQKTAISHLDIEQKTIGQLHNCGFEIIEDIDSIPYAELGQRFGADFLNYLDQLWGRVADPQIATTPPENFEASADFAEPIRNLTWINQQLDRLLTDLQHFISTRQLVCRSFTWRFYHENNRLLQTVTVGLSARQNAIDTFRELTDLKLASIKLDWEFSSIELSSTQLVPIQLFNDDLFDPQPDHQQFNQLIDKLSNRLGHTALFRVHMAPEHLPELTNDRQHAVQETALSYKTALSHKTALSQKTALSRKKPLPAAHAASKELQDQPLWLLESPQRLAQQHHQPRHEGPLNIIHGPDRITSHWWSKLQSRDYFIARQQNGRLLWIFFDRGAKCWFLHGLFA